MQRRDGNDVELQAIDVAFRLLVKATARGAGGGPLGAGGVKSSASTRTFSWGFTVVLINLDLADTVGVAHFPSILLYCRVIGIPSDGAVGLPNSGGHWTLT